MSRIGKLPVEIPAGVTIQIEGRKATATGPKGVLSIGLPKHVKLAQSATEVTVSKADETNMAQEQWGLTRTLIANLVHGVAEGFTKQLEIQGVGYRVSISGSTINLALGYSHPIEYKLPEGILATAENNIITISGMSKQQVGQVAAEIRSYRKPEPYKGKGIRYVGEHVRRKAGKAAAAKGAA